MSESDTNTRARARKTETKKKKKKTCKFVEVNWFVYVLYNIYNYIPIYLVFDYG